MKMNGRIWMPILLAGTVLSLTGCMDDFFYDNPQPKAIMTTPSTVQPVPDAATTVKKAPKKASGPSADHATPSAVDVKTTQEAPPIAPPVSNLSNEQ